MVSLDLNILFPWRQCSVCWISDPPLQKVLSGLGGLGEKKRDVSACGEGL